MIDSGILKDLIEKYDKQHTLLITICVFVAVNVFVAVINLISQIKIKNMDISVHKRNLREEKRMQILEDIYQKFDGLRIIFNDEDTLRDSLRIAYEFINKNTLYLNKEELKITQEYCDYFSVVLNDPRKKDIQKENELLDKFKIEFNK